MSDGSPFPPIPPGTPFLRYREPNQHTKFHESWPVEHEVWAICIKCRTLTHFQFPVPTQYVHFSCDHCPGIAFRLGETRQ